MILSLAMVLLECTAPSRHQSCTIKLEFNSTNKAGLSQKSFGIPTMKQFMVEIRKLTVNIFYIYKKEYVGICVTV